MDEQTCVLYAREWLEWLTTRGRSSGTLRVYRQTVVEFVHTHDLDVVTHVDIERWLARARGGRAGGRSAAPATQHRDAACLRSFYGWLLARGYVQHDPTVLVFTPTVRNRQPKPLPDTTWQLLWAACDGPDGLLAGLGFFGGLRRAELCQLRTSHVDVTARRIVNFPRKGGGEDVLALGTILDTFERKLSHLGAERLWPLIEKRCTHDGWLVGWPDIARGVRRSAGTDQLDPQHINHWFDRVCRVAEVGHLSPHQLRHSFVTNLLRAGVPLPIVSNLANHANVSTTMRYAKSGSDALREWLSGTAWVMRREDR